MTKRGEEWTEVVEEMVDEDTADWLVDLRRHLHAHPELSLVEHQTASYIRERLAEIGIEAVEEIGETGTVATIEGGGGEGPTLAWRADIDALPIREESDCAYRSQNEGVMHACGHDVHTTIGLGLAARMHARRDELAGRLKLIFQPAEEASPVDEPIGAERMVREGVLEDPEVDAIFALHCMPTLPVGKIGYTGGPVWAGSDLLEIEVIGEKTHGAYPHTGVDAALSAAQIVVALQSVVSRNIDARDACVISVGRIESGESYNIIADRAKLTGTMRTLSESTAEDARVAVRRVVEGVAAAMGARAEVSWTPGARPTINDIELERRVVASLRGRLGDDRVVAHAPQMGAEDFASFSRRVPACYLFLGVRNEERGITHMIHTSRFDVDERCLPLAVGAFTETLLELARERSTR